MCVIFCKYYNMSTDWKENISYLGGHDVTEPSNPTRHFFHLNEEAREQKEQSKNNHCEGDGKHAILDDLYDNIHDPKHNSESQN